MKKATRLAAIAFGLAIVMVMLASLFACQKDVNANQPQTARSCDSTCTEEDDTISVEGIWLKPTGVPDGVTPMAELTWTVDGVVQHDQSRPYTGGGTTYHAWYHSWKKNKYPRISITVDTNVHGGLWCKILYKPAGKPVEVVDWEQLGPKAPPGKVTCTSDAWLNTHLNHDE